MREHPMVGKRRKCASCKKRRITVGSLDKERKHWVCEECYTYQAMMLVGTFLRKHSDK